MRAMTVVCAVCPCFSINKTFSFSHQSLQIDCRHCPPLMTDAKPINPSSMPNWCSLRMACFHCPCCFPTCLVQLFRLKLTHNYDIMEFFLLSSILVYILYSNNYNFHIRVYGSYTFMISAFYQYKSKTLEIETT